MNKKKFRFGDWVKVGRYKGIVIDENVWKYYDMHTDRILVVYRLSSGRGSAKWVDVTKVKMK